MKTTKIDRGKRVELPQQAQDPVLAMLGVGHQLWQDEAGDPFVERLRSEDAPAPRGSASAGEEGEKLAETVWHRIQMHEGELFHTARGLPFAFEVEGNGIWFFRDKKRIERKLSRKQVEAAIARCPLRSTTEIKDLMDFAYLFALLMDRRIRGEAW